MRLAPLPTTSTSAASSLTVIKRDGRATAYNSDRIRDAVRPAWARVCDDTVNEQDLAFVVAEANALIHARYAVGDHTVQVREIEAILESVLTDLGLAEVAENYLNYRMEKAKRRAEDTSVEHQVGRLVAREASVVNENANKDSRVFTTMRDLMAGSVSKAKGLAMLPPRVASAHVKGQIHFHDLDYAPFTPLTNCCIVNFPDMLANGFRIGNADVASPRSIQTATAQMSQIIANVSSSQYGGTTADRVDELLAPYAAMNYEKRLADAREWVEDSSRWEEYARSHTRKDIYDAMQSLEYEVNTLFSSNGQTPFVTVGFGLGTSWYEREIQKAILNVRIKGIGVDGRTAIFPKLIFTLRRGVNLDPGDPNYDIKQLAVECSTKRMYPDVISYDKIVEITGSFKAPMGCRSFLQGWQDDDGNDVTAGRMNLGVVTVNLPRIALESSGNKELFWSLLEERLEVAHEALAFRVARCKDAHPENAPILYRHGAFGRLSPDDCVDVLFRDGRATVSLGYIGLYEVATVFYGPTWESNSEAKEFTLDVVRRMKGATQKWREQDGFWYSLYATPAESLTDRFARMDLARFGPVKDITDKGYYTNSFHYDVRKSPTPFEKIVFESAYPLAGSSGGFIHYCEYPVLTANPRALEAVWDFAYDKVGYLGTNTPIDRCYVCGFTGDFAPTANGFECPQCKNADPQTCDVVKRTCGYLGNPQSRKMAAGRHKEVGARVKHLTLDTARGDSGSAR